MNMSDDCVVLDSNSPIVPDNKDILINLKMHQKALIYKCLELENSNKKSIKVDNMSWEISTKIGIIGDKVGSGKTLSILGLIANKKEIQIQLPYIINNKMVHCLINSTDEFKTTLIKTNLIVVPHNIYKQWYNSIEKFTSLTFYGINNQKSFDKFNELLDNSDFSLDILLISSTRIGDFYSKFKNYKVSRFIIDEADTIKLKNSSYLCHNLKASFIWLVSSTYISLINPNGIKYYVNTQYNTIVELNSNYNNSSIKAIYIPGISNNFIKQLVYNINSMNCRIRQQLIIKNDDKFIKEAFNLPPYITTILESPNPVISKILNTFVSKEIMDHINGGDISGAINKIDCHKTTANNLVKVITKDLEIKLNYKKVEHSILSNSFMYNEQTKQERIEKISKDINIIETKIQGIKNKLTENDYCSICYDPIKNISVTMCCKTKFCLECITTWFHKNKGCPFCRSSININNICVVIDKTHNYNISEKDTLPSKLHHMKNIINTSTSCFKMLVFSDYTRTEAFNSIIELLKELNLSYKMVKGSSATINKIISQFKLDNSDENSISVLLLNSEYCASGINLENTSDIVMFHKMNPQKKQQIIGRGQRPGRTTELKVWELIYTNEL